MPSSHMTVIVAVTFYLLSMKGLNPFFKFVMVVLCILQGWARVLLHYHTYEQVYGGVFFGLGFAIVFFKLFDMIWDQLGSRIPKWVGIEED